MIFIVLPVWDHAPSGGSAKANTAVAAITRMNRLIFGQSSPREFETIGIRMIVLPVTILGPNTAIGGDIEIAGGGGKGVAPTHSFPPVPTKMVINFIAPNAPNHNPGQDHGRR